MSQFNFVDQTSPLSGADLVQNILQPFRDSLWTQHSGTTRPTYVQAGMIWIDTSSNPWLGKFYDGSNDITLYHIDPSAHTGGPSGNFDGNSLDTDSVDNSKLANMAAYTLKGNNTNASNNPTDLSAMGIVGQYSNVRYVRVASTANITTGSTNAGASMDGITLAIDDLILLKDQTTGSQNGIYRVNNSGGLTRADNSDTWNKIVGGYVYVQEGTANALREYRNTNITGGTLNTTAITYRLWFGEGVWTPTYQAASGSPTIGYLSQAGIWMKKGPEVTYWGRLGTNAFTAAGTAVISIAGLPFTSRTTTGGLGFSGNIGYANDFTATGTPSGVNVGSGATTIQLYKVASADARNELSAALLETDMGTSTSDNEIIFSGTYLTNA